MNIQDRSDGVLWIAIWNGLQANVKKQSFFLWELASFFYKTTGLFDLVGIFLLRPMSSFVSTSRDQMSSLVGTLWRWLTSSCKHGAISNPPEAVENRYRVRSWASFAWAWWKYMFLFWTTHGYFVGFGVLFESHMGIEKRVFLEKKHTFNNSWAILLDVIGCHFFSIFFWCWPYLNSILLVEDFLPRWISQAPPPGSYRPSTHLCEPRVKTPARISRWCEDTQCLNF